MDIDYLALPEGLRAGMQFYVEEHLRPGHFLCAVLENDLSEAFARADEHNREVLFQIVSWVYNNAPSRCWGDKKKVASWLEDAP